MSGRICTVHGEWCPDGICRWCEPTKPGLELVPLREGEGSTPCRCGWMAWADYARRPFREEYNGMVHSPEQCYATAATPPAELPASPTMYETTFTLIEETTEAYVWRLEWVRTAPCLDYAHAEEEVRLLAAHCDARWERLERRWATKHGPWTLRDLSNLWCRQFDKVIAHSLKQLEESLYPLLPVPASEPKP